MYHSPNAGNTWQFNRPISGIANSILRLKMLNGEVVIINEAKHIMYFTKDLGVTWQEIAWWGVGLYNTGGNLYATDSAQIQLLRFNGGNASNWEIIPFNMQLHTQPTGVGEHNGTYWLGIGIPGVLRKKPESPKWSLSNGEPSNQGGGRPSFLDGHLFLDVELSVPVETFSPDQGITWQQQVNMVTPRKVWRKGNYNYGLSPAGHPILRCLRNDRFEWEPYGNLPGSVYQIAVKGDTLLSDKWASLNNGLSWTAVPNFQGNTTNPILTALGKFYTVKGPSLYQTSDIGLTWQPIYTFPHVVDEMAGRFYVIHDTIIISYSALDRTYYSPNGGQTFDTLVTPQNPNSNNYRLWSSNGQLLLNMDANKLYLSGDIGKTWTSINLPAGYNILSIIVGDAWDYGDSTLFIQNNWKLRLDEHRQVSGRVFLDSNSNGQKDVGEPALNNYIVQALQSGAMSTTYSDGNFSMLLGSSTDKLEVADVPLYHVSVPPSVIVPGGNFNSAPASFAIQPQGVVVDAAVSLIASSAFRAGYHSTLHMQVKNGGTYANTGQLKLVLDPLVNLVAATPAADLQNGDTLVWNYNDLPPLQVRKFQVEVKTAVTPPGTLVLLQAEALTAFDIEESNNKVVLADQVVSSYDPNDKTVSAAYLPIDQAEGEELIYTIRFQNLGNIATDFVTVRDTLASALDVTSIRVLAASHFYDWQIEDGQVLVFRFNPILLTPAATDSLRSQGFIQFAAKLRNGLQVGDEIANTAHIYFDFNPAVVTNTAVTGIQVVSTFEPSQQAPQLDIFPNPAGNQATLRLPEGSAGTGRIDIFSAGGHRVFSTVGQGSAQVIDLSAFISGATYWCRWVTAGKVYWGKLLVHR